MVIVYSDEFIIELENITDFIALDNLNRANEFAKNLKNKINKIPDMPYAYVKKFTNKQQKCKKFDFQRLYHSISDDKRSN